MTPKVLGASFAIVLMAGCDFDFDFAEEALARDAVTEEFRKELDLDPGGRLTLENANGSIEVIGWDQNRVDIQATKFAKTKADLDDLKIDVHKSADVVEVRTIRPESWNRRARGGVRYRIRVPRKTRLDRIQNTNGAVTAQSIESPVRLRSTNGTIKVAGVRGEAELNTTNGRVELADFRGSAAISTTNGGIHATGITGRLTASTTNGPIEISAQDLEAGQVHRLRSTNGSVNLELNGGKTGDVEVSTTNGRVKLRLPSNINARLRANTSNGHISTEFPVGHKLDRRRRSLDAELGSGGPVIHARTTNGGVSIERF
ncbi:MAG: DUF4097 domain-containing protein [Acidobacteria bacterium]|nr:DUF4097 domain-containing protein [Acidobacteriota bacterium]